MILPDKYTLLSESYIGLSALILELLSNKKVAIDRLWSLFIKKYDKKPSEIKVVPSYQKFIYVIEFMYLSEMINYNEEGEIFVEDS